MCDHCHRDKLHCTQWSVYPPPNHIVIGTVSFGVSFPAITGFLNVTFISRVTRLADYQQIRLNVQNMSLITSRIYSTLPWSMVYQFAKFHKNSSTFLVTLLRGRLTWSNNYRRLSAAEVKTLPTECIVPVTDRKNKHQRRTMNRRNKLSISLSLETLNIIIIIIIIIIKALLFSWSKRNWVRKITQNNLRTIIIVCKWNLTITGLRHNAKAK